MEAVSERFNPVTAPSLSNVRGEMTYERTRARTHAGTQTRTHAHTHTHTHARRQTYARTQADTRTHTRTRTHTHAHARTKKQQQKAKNKKQWLRGPMVILGSRHKHAFRDHLHCNACHSGRRCDWSASLTVSNPHCSYSSPPAIQNPTGADCRSSSRLVPAY